MFEVLSRVDGMVLRADPDTIEVSPDLVDGLQLLLLCHQVVAADPDAPRGLMRWVRLRAGAEIHGDSITDIASALGIPRRTFYTKTTAIALRVVAILNARALDIPALAYGVDLGTLK